MNTLNPLRSIFGLFLACVLLVACGGGSGSSSSSSTSSSTDDDTSTSVEDDGSNTPVDPDLFLSSALAEIVTTESCTLSNGETSECYRITLTGFPADQAELGAFCPRTIYDSAEMAGTWFDDGVLYDADGEFIENLAVFYDDNNWQLFDTTTGDIYVTDTEIACNAAAQPNVAEEYQNHCVECSIDYISEADRIHEVLLPTVPVRRSSAQSVSGTNPGVSLNGVQLAQPAPTDAILGAYTIAAFDDCVGHINPAAGYHYHGANGCSEIASDGDGHAAMFAYAMDGYGIYSQLDDEGNEPDDLDSCRGHTDDTRGYHYHAASPGENMFIGCFSGETAR